MLKMFPVLVRILRSSDQHWTLINVLLALSNQTTCFVTREFTDLLNTLQGVLILLIFMRQKKKRTMVLDRLRKMTNRAQEAVQKFTVSDEISNTIVSNDKFLENLPGSDRETIEKIRSLSRQEETVTSTILKSVSQNKIEFKEIALLKEVHNAQSEVDIGSVDDGNQFHKN